MALFPQIFEEMGDGMIELQNIRVEERGGQKALVCDIKSTLWEEKTMWFSVPKQYGDMLTDSVYDPFLTAILFPAMDAGEDIAIHGCVTKRLYKNTVTYVEKILMAFANYLKKVDVCVDGFSNVMKTGNLVGTGFSAGVDSFSTFYEHFEKEDDPDYKINALFFFNTGSHGAFGKKSTIDRFHARYEYLSKFPMHKGIPFIPVDSNVHAFHEKYGHQKTVVLTIACAIQAFQKCMNRYYCSNAYSYLEEKLFAMETFDFDTAEFGEFVLFPLLSPEGLEIVSDGGQYTRTEKESLIADYGPAKEYLNVCVTGGDEYVSSRNCSCCPKCLRTLMAFDSMGKLNNFSNVFDLNIYKKHAFSYKCEQRVFYKKNGFAKDNIDFARINNKRIPPYFLAFFCSFPMVLSRFMLRFVRRILGNEMYGKLKRRIKGFRRTA